MLPQGAIVASTSTSAWVMPLASTTLIEPWRRRGQRQNKNVITTATVYKTNDALETRVQYSGYGRKMVMMMACVLGSISVVIRPRQRLKAAFKQIRVLRVRF